MNRLKVSYINKDFELADFANEAWQMAEEASLHLYWSSEPAEDARCAKARIIWTEQALAVRFEGKRREPLIINSKPNTSHKSIGLWERDVFEIFVAPKAENIRQYYEFEVAPTGEWLDLRLEILPDGKRKSDFEYHSGMKVAAKILENKVQAAMKIEWRAFGRKPQNGDVWRGNLFRCVGSGKTRGYLSWQPTETETPNFHVAERFGYFEFVKN